MMLWCVSFVMVILLCLGATVQTGKCGLFGKSAIFDCFFYGIAGFVLFRVVLSVFSHLGVSVLLDVLTLIVGFSFFAMSPSAMRPKPCYSAIDGFFVGGVYLSLFFFAFRSASFDSGHFFSANFAYAMALLVAFRVILKAIKFFADVAFGASFHMPIIGEIYG